MGPLGANVLALSDIMEASGIHVDMQPFDALQFFLPFEGIDGIEQKIARVVNTTNPANYIEVANPLTLAGAGATVQSVNNPSVVSYTLKVYGTDIEVSRPAMEMLTNPEQPMPAQRAVASRRMIDAMYASLGASVTGANQVGALRSLCASSQVLDVDAAVQVAMDVPMVDQFSRLCTAATEDGFIYLCNQQVADTLRQTCETVNDRVKDDTYVARSKVSDRRITFPMMYVKGVPVAVCDRIPNYTTANAHLSGRLFKIALGEGGLVMYTKRDRLNRLFRFTKDESAATAIEYGTLLCETALYVTSAISCLQGFKLAS